MAMILVTHDLGVVAGRTDEIAVMYAGQIVEQAPTRSAVRQHEDAVHRGAAASRSRSSSDPSHTRLQAIAGRPPDLINPPPGCRFAPRCPYAQAKCRAEEPPLVEADTPGHLYRCWFPVGTCRAERSSRPPTTCRRRGRAPATRPAAEVEPSSRRPTAEAGLMAGTGTAHLRDADDGAAARRGPRRRVPDRRGGARSTPCPASASTCCEGETLGLVGESGCGKSTTGRAIMQLPPPTERPGALRGHATSPRSSGEDLREVRTALQMIFQDPISSLNPRRKVGDIVAEPLRHLEATAPRPSARAGSTRCSRPSASTPRSPARSGPTSSPAASASASRIARALVLDPKLIICDEPVSALDVSVQAQILNLLEDMKARYGLTLIFIAHDLAVVKNISDRVAVMYLGKLCEVGPPDDLYADARPTRTPRRCSTSIPVPDPTVPPVPERARSAGELPVAARPAERLPVPHPLPAGQERCAAEEPELRAVGAGPLRRLPLPPRRHARRGPTTGADSAPIPAV